MTRGVPIFFHELSKLCQSESEGLNPLDSEPTWRLLQANFIHQYRAGDRIQHYRPISVCDDAGDVYEQHSNVHVYGGRNAFVSLYRFEFDVRFGAGGGQHSGSVFLLQRGDGCDYGRAFRRSF